VGDPIFSFDPLSSAAQQLIGSAGSSGSSRSSSSSSRTNTRRRPSISL